MSDQTGNGFNDAEAAELKTEFKHVKQNQEEIKELLSEFIKEYRQDIENNTRVRKKFVKGFWWFFATIGSAIMGLMAYIGRKIFI